MVYISTAAMRSSMRLSIMTEQSQLATAQAELSSGTYADLGLHLGASSGQLLSLSEQSSRLSAYTASNALASTRLDSTQSVLSSLQSTATSFQSALTEATSAGGSTAGLQAEGSTNLTELIASLNTVVGGEAIFGGLNTGGTPVASYGDGSATKTAVDSAFSSTFGTTPTSSSASSITASQMTDFLNGGFGSLFSASSFGSTWSTATDATRSTEISPGNSVSTSVSANAEPMRQLAEAYTMIKEYVGSSSGLSASAQQAVITSASTLVDNAISKLTDLQASVGTVQNAITDADTQNSAQSALLTTQTSTLHDTDPYALNTQITNLQTQIEASYQLTSQLKQLSLVNYLS